MWQSFKTRYNTYFNGHEAYKQGMEAKEKGVSDNYTERLPFFMVGNTKSAELGKGQFETAITKCEKSIQLHSIKAKPKISPEKRRTEKAKQYLARKEYNPFLKNAWLLMGQAQFQKGDYLEAASTFSYVTRLYQAEPAVANEARAWLARCYAGLDWFYDAEDVLSKMSRDSLSRRVQRERDATMADLLLRQERFEDALPYLRTAARQSKGGIQRARRYFLLGQVEQQLGNDREAYKALTKCLSQSPPYQLAFNARILHTEVTGDGRGKSQLQQLRRMARSEKNKEYLDQVYYAIGNVHLAQGDTLAAINAYETGRVKATRSGVEKGVLLLRLGQIYWERQRFDKAQGCYSEALSLVDKTRKDYDEMMRRSKILDHLVPYTSAVFLQDSLQTLAGMSEEERNAAIDRVIEALKKKEKEEAKLRKDSVAQARRSNGGLGDDNGIEDVANRRRPGQLGQQNQTWYFYDPMVVAQGKEEFRKRWGNRPNEDNWRRSNKTVLQTVDDQGFDYEAEDSIAALEDSLSLAAEDLQNDSVLTEENDPHKRAYYLKQIPFTQEQREASNLIIMDGLYNAGVIEKDELEDFPLAEGTLQRLVKQYPTFQNRQDALYQLFLLYSRWHRDADASRIRDLMAEEFPDSSTTKLILDPNYLVNARFAREMEDSLYAATYNAYLQHDADRVETNFQYSTQHYPQGLNRPRFTLLHALSRIGRADDKEVGEELRTLAKDHSAGDVATLAGLIVNGLDAGREFAGGTLNPGSLWDRRTAMADSIAEGDSIARTLLPDRDTRFVLLIAYPKDSLDDNRLLYDIAHFNFTGFYVRSFEMEKLVDASGLTQFRIRGFRSYDEAHAYAQELFGVPAVASQLQHARTLLISEHNMNLLGRQYSFEDYQEFFDKTFAPMKLNPNLPLDDAPPAEQRYDDAPEQIYPLPTKEAEVKTENVTEEAKAQEERMENPLLPNNQRAEDADTDTDTDEEGDVAEETDMDEEADADAEESDGDADEEVEEADEDSEENTDEPDADSDEEADEPNGDSDEEADESDEDSEESDSDEDTDDEE
ncbi:MAG: tetratricopeptide repeat protein [Alloprevotella sp.]|nr:tetratricopeptide repeat protein [Alloprevotella sp.]